jgi:tetratricopeptide (TPR) repeat protein
MSGAGWLAWVAGLWLALAGYRWRRDVARQQRERARDLAHKAAGRLPPFRPPRRTWILAGLWAVGLYAAVSAGYFVVAVLAAGLPLLCWVLLGAVAQRNLKRGRYVKALRPLDLLLAVAPGSPGLLLRRGETLLAAGRLADAEDALRRSLGQGARAGRQARALECLAYTLLPQDRHQEAAQAVAGALKIMPRNSGLHNALAETHLHEGAELEEALVIANRAFEYESKARHKSGPNRFAEIWANRAWALGLLGRREPMLQAVRHALESADESERPRMAGVFWRLGAAFQAVGEHEEAMQSFEDARATDSAGLYGILAARALERQG